jgi:hypothetical protein
MLRSFSALGIALAAGVAIAQERATLTNYSVAGVYDGSGVALEIFLDASTADDPFSVLGQVTGLDVHRTSLELNQLFPGYCQLPDTRITDSPLPWTSAVTTPLAIRDDDVEPDRFYVYEVRAVNAAREPLPVRFGWDLPLDGFVRTGDTPVAHASIQELVPHGPWYIAACERECGWGGLAHMILAVRPPSPTGVYWIYGEPTFHDPQHGWRLTITDIRPAPGCLVAVTPATWGAAKSLYR